MRFANTVGLVVERTRPEGSPDAMRWYCPNKQAHGDTPTLVREVKFQCTDLGTQLKPIIDSWVNDEQDANVQSAATFKLRANCLRSEPAMSLLGPFGILFDSVCRHPTVLCRFL